jgi:hypothetical protein
LYRLRQIARYRAYGEAYITVAKKWLKVPEKDFKVLLLKAEQAFVTVDLQIAEHTRNFGKERRSLSRSLGLRIVSNQDNVVESLRRCHKTDDVTKVINRKQIEKEAIKYEFELIFFG